MREYFSTVSWVRGEQKYSDNRYSRGHQWTFDEGVTVPASASPHIVPLPMSVEAAVDPEEALVASLSSCHMLFFLDFSRQRGFIVDAYVDEAVGVMEKNAHGITMMTTVTLRPKIDFSGDVQPDEAEIEAIHHAAHEACFIANSVKTEVRVESP